MERFFITGLPRSRTAWLSAVFTHPEAGCHCVHEPDLSFDFLSLPRKWANLVPAGTRFAGISAPGLHLKADELMRWYPDAPWLIVNRHVDEVATSLQALKVKVTNAELAAGNFRLFKTFRQAKKALMVDYHTLSDLGVMEAVWHTLCPGVPFDAERQKAMENIRIVNQKSEADARRLTL